MATIGSERAPQLPIDSLAERSMIQVDNAGGAGGGHPNRCRSEGIRMRKNLLHYAIAAMWCITASVAVGCGVFSEDVRSTVVGVGVDAAVKAIQKAIGEAGNTSPTVCEVENNTEDAQLLVLCTVCYGEDTTDCAP